MNPSLEFWGVYGALDLQSTKPFHIEFFDDGQLDLFPLFKQYFGHMRAVGLYDQIPHHTQIHCTFAQLAMAFAIPHGPQAFASFIEQYLDMQSPQNESLTQKIMELEGTPIWHYSRNALDQMVIVPSGVSPETIVEALPRRYFNFRKRKVPYSNEHRFYKIPSLDIQEKPCTPPIISSSDGKYTSRIQDRLVQNCNPPVLFKGYRHSGLDPISIITRFNLPREEYQVTRILPTSHEPSQ